MDEVRKGLNKKRKKQNALCTIYRWTGYHAYANRMYITGSNPEHGEKLRVPLLEVQGQIVKSYKLVFHQFP